MKAIDRTNGKRLVSDNYKPYFAYKSLITLLEKNGLDVYKSCKSKNTNSYYILACDDNESVNFEIRISDHSKFLESWENHELISHEGKNNLDLDIITKNNFKEAKQLIINKITNHIN